MSINVDLSRTDLFRIYPMNIPMEIEPEIVDMRTPEEIELEKKKTLITRYPKFTKKGEYLLGLGHMWKLVDEIKPGSSVDDYIYIGDELWYKMR